MQVALVHDQLNQRGGGERVLQALRALYPDAPIYTLVGDRDRVAQLVPGAEVRVSPLQRIPLAKRHHRALLPLYPLAVERVDLYGYDLIISSSAAWSKGVRVPEGATHMCYCHSPMRFAWDLERAYVASQPWWIRPALPPLMAWLRAWDQATASRVDAFAANSRYVADRIRRCYGRSATVIYPPVDIDHFTPEGAPGDYFLVVSRLVPYKRIEIAVEACTRLGVRLIVVGGGPERARLAAIAGPTVELVGEVDDAELRRLYAGALALLFPGVEDFGLAPVEAQACGRPVIAYAEGGALESVIASVTGVLVPEQSVEAFATVIRTFDPSRFDSAAARANASRFGRQRFLEEFAAFVTTGLRARAKGPEAGGVPRGAAAASS